MNVYIGDLPAEMIKDNSIIHVVLEGVMTRGNNLTVTFVDESNGQRVDDANVTVFPRHEGHASEFLRLGRWRFPTRLSMGIFSFLEEGAFSL